MPRLIIPYATTPQVINLIDKTYPRSVDIEELSIICGMSKSAIANIIPTVELLGLSKREKNRLNFTKSGLRFGKALKVNNIDEMKQIVRENIRENLVFNFVIDLLNSNEVLKNEEVGEKLARKFNKNWSNPLTFARYGACVSDIIAFAGYGYYTNGILTLRKIVKRGYSGKLPVPHVSIGKIKEICEKLKSDKKGLQELSKELGTRDTRLVSELSNCVALGLVDKKEKMYLLSENGYRFINPLISKEEKKVIFRNCLINSQYFEVIQALADLKREFETKAVGEFLAYKLKRGWSTITKETVGKKLLSWMIYSKLIGKVKRGHYEIDKELLKELKKSLEKGETLFREEKTEIPKKEGRIDTKSSKIFKMGILLERIKTKIENKTDIEKEILELISLCNSVSQLEDIADLIKSHYEFYKENKDSRVLTPDLNLIDKMVGGE